MRRKVRPDWRAVAKHCAIDDCLTVNRHGHGSAYTDVIEWLQFVVDRKDGFTLGVA